VNISGGTEAASAARVTTNRFGISLCTVPYSQSSSRLRDSIPLITSMKMPRGGVGIFNVEPVNGVHSPQEYVHSPSICFRDLAIADSETFQWGQQYGGIASRAACESFPGALKKAATGDSTGSKAQTTQV
jgi:hypothetical protein